MHQTRWILVAVGNQPVSVELLTQGGFLILAMVHGISRKDVNINETRVNSKKRSREPQKMMCGLTLEENTGGAHFSAWASALSLNNFLKTNSLGRLCTGSLHHLLQESPPPFQQLALSGNRGHTGRQVGVVHKLTQADCEKSYDQSPTLDAVPFSNETVSLHEHLVQCSVQEWGGVLVGCLSKRAPSPSSWFPLVFH